MGEVWAPRLSITHPRWWCWNGSVAPSLTIIITTYSLIDLKSERICLKAIIIISTNKTQPTNQATLCDHRTTNISQPRTSVTYHSNKSCKEEQVTAQNCSDQNTSKAKPSQINLARMQILTIREYFLKRPYRVMCTRWSKDLRPILQTIVTLMQIIIMYRQHQLVYRQVPMWKREASMSTSTCCRNHCLLISLRVSSTHRTQIQRIRRPHRITDHQTMWTNRRTCHIRYLECHQVLFQWIREASSDRLSIMGIRLQSITRLVETVIVPQVLPAACRENWGSRRRNSTLWEREGQQAQQVKISSNRDLSLRWDPLPLQALKVPSKLVKSQMAPKVIEVKTDRITWST